MSWTDHEGGCIVDFKLELVLIPVSDVDRAKAFYTHRAGFDLEVDTPVGDNMRVVQMTPAGSACSIASGLGSPTLRRGPIAAPTWSSPTSRLRVPSWSDAGSMSFADFRDPDGNTWVLQERRGEPGA
jgi:catechol 2,3-dioxygenase-like lactoylglutathione lyase family enzyme